MSIGYPDFGGIASVNAPVNIYNVSGNGVLPANSAVLGPFNVAGQSYTIKFDPQQGAGGTVPFCELEVQVIDSAGFVTEDIFYEMPMDLNMLDCTYSLSGPLNGQQIVVTIVNEDTVEMFYNISINGNSTPAIEHTITTQQFAGVGNGNNTPPQQSVRKGLLGQNNRLALAAGNSDVYIMAPCPGRLSVALRAATPANPIRVILAPMINQNNFNGTLTGRSGAAQTDANGLASLEIPVMRAAYQIAFVNEGAGPTDYVWTCVFQTTGP